MLIRYYREIATPFEVVEQAACAPRVWMPGLAPTTEREREALLSEVGFSR